jgi:ATP-binding cassette subfamily F protein uup
VRAGVKARGTKARHRLDKFYEIEGMEAPPEEREMDLLIPPPPDLGNIVVDLENAGVNISSDATPRWLFRNLTLNLRPGQCTGIVGRNGVGKTTLLKLCLGQIEPSEGTAVTGKRVKVNYIDQSRMQLDGTGSLLDEISNGNEKLMFGDQPMGARNYLRRFLFNDKRINERVDLLSGGERARLMLAKVLKNGGNVIVLDEPTNDLDLPSLRMLEEALADFDGSVICVSHDRYFLDRICDQIIAFEDDGVVVQAGNYSYYLEKRQARESAQRIQAQAAAREAAVRRKTGSPERSKPRKLSFKEKNELENIETTILAAEQEVEKIEAKLHDPDFQMKHFAELSALSEKLEAGKAEVARINQRWEELEAIRAASEEG